MNFCSFVFLALVFLDFFFFFDLMDDLTWFHNFWPGAGPLGEPTVFFHVFFHAILSHASAMSCD